MTSPAVDGATLTCTVTNSQHRSTVRVVKNWVGAPASATIFVDQNGTAPFDASTVATTNGASASFTYPLSTAVTVGEQAVPGGYSATIDCGWCRPLRRRPVRRERTGLSECDPHLHDHEQAEALDRPDREAVGRSARLGDDLRRPGRHSAVRRATVATADGDSTSFTYPVSTPVNVGETTVPAGYSATIDCGQGPQPYTGRRVPGHSSGR